MRVGVVEAFGFEARRRRRRHTDDTFSRKFDVRLGGNVVDVEIVFTVDHSVGIVVGDVVVAVFREALNLDDGELI